MPNRYCFYEVVLVEADAPVREDLKGSAGIIVGMSEDDNGCWEYAVQLPKHDNECWQIAEGFLKATGKRVNREDLYNGDSELVRVDPDTGDGEIVEKDEFN